ncbi:Uu.00g147290.m01.CDS01 [Anthostomella pinea]|uniref:Uu.00g147290.m01.CDS01 n=1 Tax=Anthostomella pinea TaxID=933095 RepID=A0AAI8VSA8_9PEZI|nr:Uu.00g147290.m01.CDS01 [Anthostomella pinea]
MSHAVRVLTEELRNIPEGSTVVFFGGGFYQKHVAGIARQISESRSLNVIDLNLADCAAVSLDLALRHILIARGAAAARAKGLTEDEFHKQGAAIYLQMIHPIFGSKATVALMLRGESLGPKPLKNWVDKHIRPKLRLICDPSFDREDMSNDPIDLAKCYDIHTLGNKWPTPRTSVTLERSHDTLTFKIKGI